LTVVALLASSPFIRASATGADAPYPGVEAPVLCSAPSKSVKACQEERRLKLAQLPPRPIEPIGGWRLVRARDPRGGPDIVSISHTADPTRSDLNLAGMMLRCAENEFEVLVVLLEPLPPRSKPIIAIGTAASTIRVPGSVVPPGLTVLLPRETATLANGPWQAEKELPIEVLNEQIVIRGIVPITGLRQALPLLLASCSR
jgi:hypothetical protein